MDRSITGFHLDAEGDWVAELSCGHNQHVRHRPPFQLRPWVIEPEGRAAMLGTPLGCPLCDRVEPPEDVVPRRAGRVGDEPISPTARDAVDAWLAAVTIHLRIRVADDRQAELHAFLREAVPFYESPGGIRVRLLSDDSDLTRFVELVEYIDEAAYRADDERVRSDPTMADFLARWRSLLAEPPVVEVYRETDCVD